MKKTMIDRFSDFMAGKGFYIVLLLCVTALGVSGYFLFSDMSGQDQPVNGPAMVVVTPTPRPAATPSASPAAPKITPRPTPELPSTATPRPSAKPVATPTVTQPPKATPAPVPTVPATATASVFTWPVKGEVLREHSVEVLAYDVTMGDWRVHDGIDIACDPGTQVMAPAGGTVADLYTDDLMGMTVVISHAGGVVSACSNLEWVPTVEIGDLVRTGDVIGSVGDTAIAESAQGSHLHLSMTKDGVSVDPLDYLPER